MASSLVHRTMVYLGLVDDDEYDDGGYDGDYAQPGFSVHTRQGPATGATASELPGAGMVRTIGRDETPRVTAVSPRPQVVRPVMTVQTSNVNVVMPERFKDAQRIADSVKSNQPVIVNLQSVERDLARRMIDFCSGMTYALGGSMDKVADQVFLVTPPNVEVTEEERQRLENGQYRG